MTDDKRTDDVGPPQDGCDRRIQPPATNSELDILIERGAAHGARRMAKELGLDDPEVRKALKKLPEMMPELVNMTSAWKSIGFLKKIVIWTAGLASAISIIAASIHWPWHK